MPKLKSHSGAKKRFSRTATGKLSYRKVGRRHIMVHKGPKRILGICLGHQLMALANGGLTEKLKYGHRGANQSVYDISKDRVFVTTFFCRSSISISFSISG